MATLILRSNNAANPQTLDLSSYLRLQPDQGTDPAGPAFTNRVFGRSLLREGATLALEQNVEREWTFPLALHGGTQSVVNGQLVQQINQIVETAGATLSWQDDGMSQPTYADILSGQVQIEYDYFRSGAKWCNAKLIVFTTPFGRTAGPRAYAAGSAAGPLAILSPYNYLAGGSTIIGASTQAGVAGFGGRPLGASSGVFYPGAPSLAGDAPAQLQLTILGTLPSSLAPAQAISILPDQNYNPTPSLTFFPGGAYSYGASTLSGQVIGPKTSLATIAKFFPTGDRATRAPISWAGQHRVFAVARASALTGSLELFSLTDGGFSPTIASVPPTTASAFNSGGGWLLYDLGTFSLRPSQAGAYLSIVAQTQALAGVDVGGVIMLPEATTWFAGSIPALLFGGPGLFIDDLVGEQYSIPGFGSNAPSPIGLGEPGARITQYSRGLIPRPDPKNGIPVIAVLSGASTALGPTGSTQAQVSVLERTRYILS